MSLKLHEIVDQVKGTLRGFVENEKEISQPPTNYDNDLSPSENTLLVNQPQQP